MKVTDRVSLFIGYYLADPGRNAAKAAISAGYSAKSAKQQACRLMADADIKAEIASRMNVIAEKLEISAERVLQAIAQVAFGDIRGMFDSAGNLLKPHQWDPDTAAVVAGIDIVTESRGEGQVQHIAKIKRADRLRALDQLARHFGLYNDKLDVTVNDGIADRLARAERELEQSSN
ncbi:MAG: terminase small subunit [Stappiaceae bacterium]